MDLDFQELILKCVRQFGFDAPLIQKEVRSTLYYSHCAFRPLTTLEFDTACASRGLDSLEWGPRSSTGSGTQPHKRPGENLVEVEDVVGCFCNPVCRTHLSLL